MKKNWLDRAICASLLILNIIFLMYWCVLAYYSPLHYDDLHFLWRMREMSVLDFVKYFYLTRSGRFVVYGIDAVVSLITDALGFHQFWALVYYVIGVGLCWLTVKDLRVRVSRFGLFMGTCFIYNLYILTNIDFPVFYWPCAMMYYLSMPSTLLLVKYLNLRQLKWTQWMIFVIIVFFIGGSYESYTPIVLLFMFINGLYWWHSKEWNARATWALPQVRRIVFTAVALLVLLLIVVAAPGNYIRLEEGMKGGEGFAHPHGILGWLKAMSKAVGMYFYFMAFYIPYYLSVALLGVYVGNKSSYCLPIKKPILLLSIVLGFIVYLIVSALPNAYLYNGFGIQRNYAPTILVLLLVVGVMGYVIGNGKEFSFSGWCTTVSVLAIVAIMCVNIAEDTPIARCYGKAVDKRIEYLCSLKEKGQKETVVVEPLPVPYTEDVKHFVLSKIGRKTTKSVLYYISDTDTVPNEYEGHMRKVLKLDFDFVISNNANQER